MNGERVTALTNRLVPNTTADAVLTAVVNRPALRQRSPKGEPKLLVRFGQHELVEHVR